MLPSHKKRLLMQQRNIFIRNLLRKPWKKTTATCPEKHSVKQSKASEAPYMQIRYPMPSGDSAKSKMITGCCNTICSKDIKMRRGNNSIRRCGENSTNSWETTGSPSAILSQQAKASSKTKRKSSIRSRHSQPISLSQDKDIMPTDYRRNIRHIHNTPKSYSCNSVGHRNGTNRQHSSIRNLYSRRPSTPTTHNSLSVPSRSHSSIYSTSENSSS